MKKADPKVSEGARMEREAFRRYLRRRLVTATGAPLYLLALEHALEWVLERRKRYDQKPKGLGK